MKKLILITLAGATLLSGCAMTDWTTAHHDKTVDPMVVDEAGRLGQSDVAYFENGQANVLGEYEAPQNTNVGDDLNFQRQGQMNTGTVADGSAQVSWNHAYGEPTMIKNINNYVRGIMHKLVDNIHYINDKTPIGVASFIFLDSSYKESNLLGNQITESFMHEVHQFGIPVIDFKTTDYIRVTESGDFIFSRDFLELKDELPMKYVLAGTLVKHEAGYIVNARIIGLTSKAIVASAQGFIPNAVADALMPSGMANDGIMLMQGE
jgi:TolB-like protein